MRRYGIALALSLLLIIPAGLIVWATGAPNVPTAIPTENPGEILVSWEPADNANWVYIGWADRAEVDAMTGAGRDWQDAIHFATVPSSYTTHTISGLKPATKYFVAIGTHPANSRYDAKDLLWSQDWASVTTAAYPESHSPLLTRIPCSPAPATVSGEMVHDSIQSSSTTAGVDVKLTLTIGDPGALTAGSSVVLYLEDDFQVGAIDMSRVYFVGADNACVHVTEPVEVDDDDHFGGDDDWSIRVFVPDMDPGNGFDDWSAADARGIQLVLDEAGIKNPTEQGSHSAHYAVLAPEASVPWLDNLSADERNLEDLKTWAKVSLSADRGGRGKEIIVTGTGFNNHTGAEVFVLVSDTEPSCLDVVLMGESLGTALVGSDDKFEVTFTVHQHEFDPGAVNWICATDSESGNPRLAEKAKVFDLTPTVSVDPTSASYGDEIVLKARDFGGLLSSISLGPWMRWTNDGDSSNDAFAVDIDGNDYIFDLPGGLDDRIQVAARGTDGNGNSVTKTVYMTVWPSKLLLSKPEVAPNESIIIVGRGFATAAEIPLSSITLDGEPLAVDEAGVGSCDYPGQDCIQIDSNGEFVIKARVWADSYGYNPALGANTYTLKVVDSYGFKGEERITIKEPTVSITPAVAGPLDSIVISGANWPLSTADQGRLVSIYVDGRHLSADIDSTGRFASEVRLSSNIKLGEYHEVQVLFTDLGDEIYEETTFIALRLTESP